MSKQGQSMAERQQRDAERMQQDAERQQRVAERQQRDTERMHLFAYSQQKEVERMQRDAERMQRDAERVRREAEHQQRELERQLDNSSKNAVVLNNRGTGSCTTTLSKLENGRFCMRILSGRFGSTMAPIDGQEKIWYIDGTPCFIFRDSVFGNTAKQITTNGCHSVIYANNCKIVIEKGQTPVVSDSNGQPIKLYSTTVEDEYTKNLSVDSSTALPSKTLSMDSSTALPSENPISTNAIPTQIDDIPPTVLINDTSSSKISLSKLENGKFRMLASQTRDCTSKEMIIEGNEIIWHIGYTPTFIFRKGVYGTNKIQISKDSNGTTISTEHYKISIENGKIPVCSDLRGYRIELNASTIEELYTKKLPAAPKNMQAEPPTSTFTPSVVVPPSTSVWGSQAYPSSRIGIAYGNSGTNIGYIESLNSNTVPTDMNIGFIEHHRQ